MKNLVLTVFALCLAGGAAAQTTEKTAPEGYRFTDVKILPVTSVKDQSRSGTCWCYSTLSFLESEILPRRRSRTGPLGDVDCAQRLL